MKLSQTNGSLLGIGLSEYESVEALSKAGFKCMDISFFTRFLSGSPYWDDSKAEEIIKNYKKAFEDFGMTPVQSHEPAGNAIGDDNGSYFFKKSSRAIEMAAKLGCPSITVHPGTSNSSELSKDEFITKNVESISRLIPIAEKNNIDILIENIGNTHEKYWTKNAKDLCDLIDAFNSDRVFANWDVGHANMNGCDQYESITYIGKRLKGVHVHDNRGFTNPANGVYTVLDLHLTPFEGVVDYDSVIKALIDTGYQGTMNFEVDIPTKRSNFEGEFASMNKEEMILHNTLLYKIGTRMLNKYNIFEY